MTEETQIVHEAAAVVEATGGLGTLGINLKIFIAQFINFAVVLLVLWKWAYKPIIKLLDQRSEKIEKSVKDAEEIDRRLLDLEKEQKEVIQKAKKEASAILEKAQVDADLRKKDLIAKAKGEVENVVYQGKEQLKTEKEAMLNDLKKEIVELAVLASQKILEGEMDEKKSQKIAESVVKEIS